MTPQTKICLSSADGHVGAPTKTYKKYLEKALHNEFDEYFASHKWRWSLQSKDSFFPREAGAKMWNTEGFDPELGTAIAWDSNLRLKAQDDARVAFEIFFPDDQGHNDPPWGAGLAGGAVGGAHGGVESPPSHVRAGARAYNRWLADFCSADPVRLKGVIILGTMEDPIWCVEEIQRAYESGLRTGVMLPLDYDQPYYHHPRYDMVWETCQELGLPLISHVSRGHPKWLGDDPWVQRFLYLHESNWYAQRPIWCMIMGGVFERFPKLHLIPTELGVGWIPPLIATLDYHVNFWPEMQASREIPGVTKLQMKPSEYWRRNVFVAHTASQKRAEFETPAFDAVPNMIFGLDIGHVEGWWPMLGWPEPVAKGNSESRPPLSIEDGYKKIWGGLPAERMTPFFESNCFRAYPNLDRSALQPIVDRLCPTIEEIGLAC